MCSSMETFWVATTVPVGVTSVLVVLSDGTVVDVMLIVATVEAVIFSGLSVVDSDDALAVANASVVIFAGMIVVEVAFAAVVVVRTLVVIFNTTGVYVSSIWETFFCVASIAVGVTSAVVAFVGVVTVGRDFVAEV